MNRTPQLAIIVSAGLLLFVAAQWPRYTVPGCLFMFGVIWLAVSKMRPDAPAKTASKQRNLLRRIAGFAIAAALLIWVVISLRQA